MVWFQCEACGENLKKPKLPNHFRICSAYKLSCIDCGEVFDKQSVQSHTQCISEAEKYGPKGLVKTPGSTPGKANKDKPKPDVDINVGLSQRPPWFCSLCNTQATSQQTLLLHADGKKHRAKARAYAAKQQPSPPDEGAVTNKDSNGVPKDTSRENGKENGALKETLGHDNSSDGNGNVSKNKRKNDASNDIEKHANGIDAETATQVEAEDVPKKSKKAKQDSQMKGGKKEGSEPKIKWKKLITSVLKSTPEGALKMKKLQKLVSKSLMESGVTMDDNEFETILEHKVNSSSKFELDGKYVKMAC